MPNQIKTFIEELKCLDSMSQKKFEMDYLNTQSNKIKTKQFKSHF